MRSALLIELKRAFLGWPFLLTLAVGVMLAAGNSVLVAVPHAMANATYFEYASAKGVQMASMFENWIGTTPYTITTSIFYYALPLLACIPFAASLSDDIASRYASQIIVHIGRRRYFIAKSIAVFATAGTVVIVPLVLNIVTAACLLPQITPDPTTRLFAVMSNSMLAEFAYAHPWGYIATFLVLTFVGSGVFGLTSVALSFFLRNRFAVALTPFIACVMLQLITQGTALAGFAPLNVLLPAQTYPSIFPVVIGLIAASLLAVIAVIARYGSRFEEL